ncbi:hypothetical protein KR018_003896 [Drosophila ironensis]|nr:hypothetical protein KR018_003896 [Drosophila ironensis]
MKLEELLTKGSSSPPQEEDDEEDEKAEPPQKQQQQQKASSEGEGAENAEEANEDAGEKDGAGGGGQKKKGTRKKRSLNWEEAERGLLLEVIKSKVAFVENRSVDAKSIKAKRLAWTQITKQFNALNFRHRLMEQIQVQWRSMKNSAKREHQQKHPKSETLEGMRMIEFMEEMQKDPVTSRSQTRSANTNGSVVKKEPLLDIDEDEDMPLAALPNSTNASEDTLQTSTIAIPSPPPSTAGGDGDSQQEGAPAAQQPAQRRKRAKAKASPSLAAKTEASGETGGEENEKMPSTGPQRKRRQRNLSQAQSLLSDENEASNSVVPAANQLQTFSLAATSTPEACSQPVELVSSVELEQKYRQELFKLLKQARLAEIDYARREHEQKLRFEQMEQETKLAYYRQEQDLKLRHMREEHDIRLRQQRREHEARLSVYACRGSGLNGNGSIQEQSSSTATKCNAKADYNNVHESGQAPLAASATEEGALAACN